MLSCTDKENDAFVYPICQSVSYALSTFSQWQNHISGNENYFVYHTDGNPTISELESKLCKLQGRESCHVTSSGKSAICKVLLTILKSGDHVILPRELYRSTRFFITEILYKFGVTHTLVDIDDVDSIIEASSHPKTKLLFIESPTNPMTRLADLEALASFCRERGIISVLDNSLASFLNHHNSGFDIIVHSLSKYCTGVSDVMGGAILGDYEIIKKIRATSIWYTDAMDSYVASLMLRGLETFKLRYITQSSNAKLIAEELQKNSLVERILYPGLETHPDYFLAKKQMRYFGNIISLDLKIKKEGFADFFNALKIWKLAFGAGFTKSIIAPSELFYVRGFEDMPRGLSKISATTVRLSVGLEPVDALIEDINSSLESLSISDT